MSISLESITELFGSNVFNDIVMRERLPKDIYKAFKKTLISKLRVKEAVKEGIKKLLNPKAFAVKNHLPYKYVIGICHWHMLIRPSFAHWKRWLAE